MAYTVQALVNSLEITKESILNLKEEIENESNKALAKEMKLRLELEGNYFDLLTSYIADKQKWSEH